MAHQQPRNTAAYAGFFAWSIATFLLAKAINVFSFWVPRKLMPYVGLAISSNALAEIVVHHLIQLTITIVCIAVAVCVLNAATWQRFGFTLNRWRSSFRDIGIFVIVWAVIQFGVGWLLVSRGAIPHPVYELNPTHLAGVYLFQLFLSGLGEEPLYRGLVMVSVYLAGQRVFRRDRFRMAAAILVSTAVFMFDHIDFAIRPFSITHFNPLQQLTLLVFGVFYGLLFFKYRSLFGPVVAHGALNVIIVSSGVLFSLMG